MMWWSAVFRFRVRSGFDTDLLVMLVVAVRMSQRTSCCVALYVGRTLSGGKRPGISSNSSTSTLPLSQNVIADGC